MGAIKIIFSFFTYKRTFYSGFSTKSTFFSIMCEIRDLGKDYKNRHLFLLANLFPGLWNHFLFWHIYLLLLIFIRSVLLIVLWKKILCVRWTLIGWSEIKITQSNGRIACDEWVKKWENRKLEKNSKAIVRFYSFVMCVKFCDRFGSFFFSSTLFIEIIPMKF